MICSTVNVAVRIRPLVPYELENGSKTCVAVVQGKEKIQVEGNEKSFRFDHVFGPDVNNESFYNSLIRNKVAEVFNDRDVTIFAYGQRRSGKTHTMGTNYTGEDHMGIIPRAIDTLFSIINLNGAEKYKVTVTFTELYKRNLYDLLASNAGTERIVEMKKNGSTVVNLTESEVTNVETAMQCLVEGSQKRVTSEKRENSQSTRSHAIFTITIYQRKTVDPRITAMSKLHLVDLASSKHDKKNGKKATVNKDLLAIRNCINYEQKGESDSYTKYQNSRLAILLRDSLQGNSTVLIIACVSPASYCLVETLQTLRYVNRLRKIKKDFSANQTNPIVNKIETKMDTKSIEAKQNLLNGLEVQKSTSTMDVQESDESKTNDNMKAEWILDTQDLVQDWFQRELDIDTEDPQTMLAARNPSKSMDITYETLEDEVDDDWEASLIRNALKLNESTSINQETLQKETDDDIEAPKMLDAEDSSKQSTNKQKPFHNEMGNNLEGNEFIPDAQRILNVQDSSKQSINKQKLFQNERGNNLEANAFIPDAQRILNAQDSNKWNINKEESFQNEVANGSETNVFIPDAERILNAQGSSKLSINKQESFQSEVGNDSKANGLIPDAQRILNAQNMSKCGEIQQETFQRVIHDDCKAELIPNAEKSGEISRITPKTFQRETVDDIKGKRILDSQDSSKCSEIKQETFQIEMDEDSETESIQNDRTSSESSEIEEQEFRGKPIDGTEIQRNFNIFESYKSIEIEHGTFQNKMDADSEAESIQNSQKLNKFSKVEQEQLRRVLDDDNAMQGFPDVLESSKSSKSDEEMGESETDGNTKAECIREALDLDTSGKYCKDMLQTEMDNATEAKRIQKILESSISSKSEQEIIQSETDEDTEAERTQNTLESSKSGKTGQDSTHSRTDDGTDAQSIRGALESNKSVTSEPEMTQSKTNVDTKVQRIQDAVVSNKTSKSATKTFQTKMDEETDAESFRDSLESNKYRKTKQAGVQIEVDDKTSADTQNTIQNTLESTKSRKIEYRNDPNEMDINAEIIEDALESNKSRDTDQEMFQTKVDDATNAEGFQPAFKFSKLNEAHRENILTETSEDSPTNLFSKIADFFLEPSPDEEKELRKEIRNLRKKLRDRTARLKTNIMDDLSLRENVELSTTRRENAKLVVAKILEEFQEVLAYVLENSEIRDWIVRVFRKIRDLFEEQKKITGKMLNCKVVDDEAMDEKYAEHTMRQVDRYHELQSVNRCIALLEELVASLPKESITIGDILRNLEDTTNQIKELEIEKVDLVKVLKSAEPLNESRTLAEFGIDKVLEMDEKISRLWRRRIKQMIAIERRDKFDQQITNMSMQLERLKTARVRLVEEMKDAEKRWNLTSASGEKKKRQNLARTKKVKYSRVPPKCNCTVLGCMSRRCSCVKSGMSCINCNCNAELCQNSDKENNTSNVFDDSHTFSTLSTNDDWKCGCTTDCLNRRCKCGKNGVFCNDNCRCRPEFCKNKNKENGTTESSFKELQVPSTSTDGKMEVDRAVSSLHGNSCVCRENGATCTNCNRSFKLREYKAKARRRLFADIDNENEEYEDSRKRPRLDV